MADGDGSGEKPKLRVGTIYCPVNFIRGGTSVVCGRCQHEESAPGTDQRSIDYCFVSMRLNCPQGVSAHYVNAASEPKNKEKAGGGRWRFFDANGVEVPPAPRTKRG